MEREWPESPVSTNAPGGVCTQQIVARITQRHLDRGIPGSPTQCALALGLIDAGFIEPHIEFGAMTIKGLNGEAFPEPATLGLDNITMQKLMDFDKEKDVEPWEMNIRCYHGIW